MCSEYIIPTPPAVRWWEYKQNSTLLHQIFVSDSEIFFLWVRFFFTSACSKYFCRRLKISYPKFRFEIYKRKNIYKQIYSLFLHFFKARLYLLGFCVIDTLNSVIWSSALKLCDCGYLMSNCGYVFSETIPNDYFWFNYLSNLELYEDKSIIYI